jgi:hypothetical protein
MRNPVISNAYRFSSGSHVFAESGHPTHLTSSFSVPYLALACCCVDHVVAQAHIRLKPMADDALDSKPEMYEYVLISHDTRRSSTYSSASMSSSSSSSATALETSSIGSAFAFPLPFPPFPLAFACCFVSVFLKGMSPMSESSSLSAPGCMSVTRVIRLSEQSYEACVFDD